MVRRSVGGVKLNTRIDRNNGQHARLEALEGRLHLSTTISAVDLSALVAAAGQSVTVTITASSPNGVRAATLFRDVNANGAFDAGIDQPLGDIFVPNLQGKFVRSITPGADWSRSTRLGVNAVDTLGQWSATGARRVDLTVNHTPTISSTTLSASSVPEGQTFTVRASVLDDVSVRAASAFLDVNQDGRWTGGVDIALGDDFTVDVNGEFAINAAAAANWNDGTGSVAVYVTAVDGEGAWSTSAQLAGRVTVLARPVIQSFTADWGSVRAGMIGTPLKVSVTASNAAAATFWLDLNGDGRWTAGEDYSLGDARDGQSGTFTLYVPSDLAGRSSAQVCANVVSGAGVWAAAPATASVATFRAPTITSFLVDTSGGHVMIAAEAQIPPDGVHAAAQVASVDFFADVNFNGVYDAGVDTLVTSLSSGTTAAGGGWRYRTTLTTQQVAALPAGEYRWFAAPRALNGAGQSIAGMGKTAIAYVHAVGEPVLMRVNPTINSVLNPTSGNAGDSVSVDVSGFSGSTVTALTLFWDANLNNRWDAGVDVDLGAYRPDPGNAMATHAFVVNLPQIAGPGAFAAATLGGDGAWSPVRSSTPIEVRYVAPPTLISQSSDADALHAVLQTSSRYGVMEFAGFIDLDNDGVADEGESLSGGASLVLGTARDGRFVLSIARAGLPAAGSYTVHVHAVDWAGVASADVVLTLVAA